MPLRDHDRVFAFLGVLTTVALVLCGSLVAVEVLVGTVLYMVAVRALRGRGHDGAALVAAYGFSLWFYWAVERIAPALGEHRWDAALLSVDQWFGATPSVAMQAWASPALTEVMSLAYFAYLPYLHGVMLWELYVGRAEALASRVFPAFALGYLGYLLVPAVGPRYAFAELYSTPLVGGWFSEFNAEFMEAGSPGTDVFPSLHVLMTLVVWTHDWRHARLRAWLMLPVVVLLTLSTLYLRYHYAMDLVAAVVVLGVVEWGTLRRSSPPAQG